jgi:homocysteine S-methyltransferase
MTRFAEIFADRPVLADGAMGTVLNARGVFTNRCYDELNLSDPNLILAVHEEYLLAGRPVWMRRARLSRSRLASSRKAASTF